MQNVNSIQRVHIQLSAQSFKYVFFNTENKILTSGAIPLQHQDLRQWEAVISGNPWEQAYNVPVYIYVWNPLFTIVPASFYDDALKVSSLELVMGQLKHQHVFAKPILSNMYLQAVPYIFEQYFTSRFKHLHWIGIPEFYLNFLSSKSTQQTAISISWHEHLLTLTAVNKQQLLFCNSYQAKDDTEALYYILFVKQHVLQSYTIGSIYLFGDELTVLKSSLVNYFKNTAFHSAVANSAMSNHKMEHHVSIELLTLHPCV